MLKTLNLYYLKSNFFLFLLVISLSFIIGGIIIFSPLWGMLLSLFFLLILASFKPLKSIILLFICFVPIIPYSYELSRVISVSIGDITFYVVEILFLLIVLLWVIQGLRRNFEMLNSNLVLPLGFFFAYTIFSTVYGGYLQGYSLKVALTDSRFYWYYFFYLVIVSVFNSTHQVKNLIRFFLIGLTIYSILCLGVHIWGDSYFFAKYIREPYTNRIGSGNDVLFSIGIPLIISLLIFPIPKIEKMLYFTMLPLFSLQVLSDQSRTLWLSLILSFFLFIFLVNFFRKKEISFPKNAIYIFIIVVVGIGLLELSSLFILRGSRSTFWEQIRTRLETLSRSGIEKAIDGRVWDYQKAFSLIKEKPIIGHGMGTSFYKPSRRGYISLIDNVWLTLWIKGGIISVLLFTWIIIRVLRNFYYILKRQELIDSYHARAFVLALAASLPSLFLTSLNTSYLIKYKVIFIFIAFMAFIEIAAKELKDYSLKETIRGQ